MSSDKPFTNSSVVSVKEFYLINPIRFEGAFAMMLKKLNLASASYNMIQSGILDFTIDHNVF